MWRAAMIDVESVLRGRTDSTLQWLIDQKITAAAAGSA
jgi:hypothetical protein